MLQAHRVSSRAAASRAASRFFRFRNTLTDQIDHSAGIYLHAKVGEYVVIARRSGDKWFVGAITNQFGREIDIDLSFLGEGKYTLTSFEDGINADRVAIDYKKRTTEVDSQSKIHIKMVNNGGWCGVIE